MAYVVGIVVALFTRILGRFAGFERDRAFYPTVLIVTASYYVLFAAMGGSMRALIVELIVMTLFALLAVAGFRFNMWLILGGLTGHAAFDMIHGQIISNPGVPAWWPAFCATYDVILAALLVGLALRSARALAT